MIITCLLLENYYSYVVEHQIMLYHILILCAVGVGAFQSWVPKSPTQISQQNLQNVLSSIISTGAVLSVPSAALAAEATKPKTKKVKVLETENGVKYIEVKKGEGAYPGDGDFVVINYTGFLSDGKTIFDTTEGKGKKPLSFRMGKKQIIPGIEEVLREMRAGGEVTCTIPGKLAYPRGVCIDGQGCLVQPGETLNYVIKLKNVAAGYQ